MDMERRFQFGHLPKVVVAHLETSIAKNLLSKWSMKEGLKVQVFHFDQDFKSYLIDEFIQDFFGSVEVMGCLQRIEANHQFSPIGIQAESIKFQRVRSTLTTVELFDRLTKQDETQENFRPIVRPSGFIIKRIPEYFQPNPDLGNPIEVADELHQLILQDFLYNQDDMDDMPVIFSADEKDEFLYRLFTHFVLGGSLCQYEDAINPYIDMTKSMYKELMTIGNPTGNEIGLCDNDQNQRSMKETDAKVNDKVEVVIKSVVIKVNSVRNENYKQEDLIFSRHHINNFFYVIVQPEEHTVYTLYHQVL